MRVTGLKRGHCLSLPSEGLTSCIFLFCRRKANEDKENIRRSDDDDEDEKEYHGRLQQSDSDNDTRSQRRKERNMTQNDIRSEKDMTIEDVAVMMMMVIMVAGVQIGEKGKNVDLTEEGKIHLQMMRGMTIAIQSRKKVNMMREENSQNKKDQQRRLKSQKRLYERRQIQIIHS